MIGKSGVAVRNIERASVASVAELAKYGVATIHEAMGRVGLLAPALRPIYPGAKVCGTAITIFAPSEDVIARRPAVRPPKAFRYVDTPRKKGQTSVQPFN